MGQEMTAPIERPDPNRVIREGREAARHGTIRRRWQARAFVWLIRNGRVQS